MAAATFLSASEWLIRVRVEPNDNLTKHVRLLKTSNEPCVAVGDSHFALGFTGNDTCVNLAYPGDTFGDMLYKLQHYSHGKEVDLAIVQVGTHLFAPYRVRPVRDILSSKDAGGLHLLMERHRINLLHYWRVVLEKHGDFSSRFSFQPTGWQASDIDWSKRDESYRQGRTSARVVQQLPGTAPGRRGQEAAFEELVRVAKSEASRVCVVAMPLSNEYLEIASSYPEFGEVRHYLADATERLSVPYVDLTEYLADPSLQHLFNDMDHLNTRGAPLVSEVIMKRCDAAKTDPFRQISAAKAG